jgi:hypothetical protein
VSWRGAGTGKGTSIRTTTSTNTSTSTTTTTATTTTATAATGPHPLFISSLYCGAGGGYLRLMLPQLRFRGREYGLLQTDKETLSVDVYREGSRMLREGFRAVLVLLDNLADLLSRALIERNNNNYYYYKGGVDGQR